MHPTHITSTESLSIKLNATDTKYSLQGIESIARKGIIGVAIRCNDNNDKLDKFGSQLLQPASIGKGHLFIKHKSLNLHDCIPLDLLVHAEKNIVPGAYVCINIPTDIVDNDQYIQFGAALGATGTDRVVELIFITQDPSTC